MSKSKMYAYKITTGTYIKLKNNIKHDIVFLTLTHIRKHTHTHMQAHMHANACTHTHTHTHTHIHTD